VLLSAVVLVAGITVQHHLVARPDKRPSVQDKLLDTASLIAIVAICGLGMLVSLWAAIYGWDINNAYAANGKPRAADARDAYAAIYRKAPVAEAFAQRWSVWAAGYGGSTAMPPSAPTPRPAGSMAPRSAPTIAASVRQAVGAIDAADTPAPVYFRSHHRRCDRPVTGLIAGRALGILAGSVNVTMPVS
jgi:hypothetical protein